MATYPLMTFCIACNEAVQERFTLPLDEAEGQLCFKCVAEDQRMDNQLRQTRPLPVPTVRRSFPPEEGRHATYLGPYSGPMRR